MTVFHTVLHIVPVAKPRMTRSDKWKQRPAVLRYRKYADELRAALPNLDGDAFQLVFQLPMPKSWPKKKRAAHNGQPHTSKPDLDNLQKAFFDALFEDDSGIWRVAAEKRWSDEGRIHVKVLP